MSRLVTPEVQVPVRDELSPYPTHKGKTAAQQRIQEWGIPMTYNLVKSATATGELASFMISSAVWYSDLDLYDWVMSKRRSASNTRSSQEVSA